MATVKREVAKTKAELYERDEERGNPEGWRCDGKGDGGAGEV